jgi:hypothetical protein
MTVVDAREVRGAGAAMLAAAAVLPHLPGHPGLVCPLRTLTGVPCPLCGLTTSVEDTVSGHVGAAVSANPGGVLLVLVAVVLLAVRPRQIRLPSAAFVLLALAMWLFELHRFSYL